MVRDTKGHEGSQAGETVQGEFSNQANRTQPAQNPSIGQSFSTTP
tara:strand:+ start:803 stop:937 length:135 start_codon:yes stop_codon:yes gene_type:complete